MISRLPRLLIANLCFAVIICIACKRPTEETLQEVDAPEEAEVSVHESASVGVVEASRELSLGQVFEVELGPERSHVYLITAEADHFLHAVVEQRGVDIIVTLDGPDNKRLLRMDRPISDYGSEHVFTVTNQGGEHRLRLTSSRGLHPSGRYSVRLAEQRPATEIDRTLASAASAYSEARSLHQQQSYSQAVERFRQALASWQELGDLAWQGETLALLGLAHARMGQSQTATKYYLRAVNLLENTGDETLLALAFRYLGLNHLRSMELEPAIKSLRKELALRQNGASRRDEALTYHSLGQAFQVQDEVQRSLDYYSKALALFNRPADRAPSIHNRGVLFLSMGRTEQAREALIKAEGLSATLGDRRRQATTLNQLGELHRRLDEQQTALEYFEHALTLRRELKDQRGEANSRANIGRVFQARGQFADALVHYQAALEILDGLEQPWLAARVLLNLGSLFLDQQQPASALNSFRRSLDLYRAVGDPTGEAEGLLGIARGERLQGRLAAAKEASEQALHIFESVRPRAVSYDLRSSFFATIQRHFEFHIDLLMELHKLDLSSGYDATALQVSEQARARSLLDLLIESGAEIRRGADPELLKRERAVQGQLNALERTRLRRHGGARQKDSERTTRRLLEELEEVQAKIRLRHPRYAELESGRALTTESIQREILDEDTLLLEYWLGEKRSFLWAVAIDALDVFELPGRDEIENRARLAYRRLIQSNRQEARASSRDALCDLSQQVLAPATHQLKDKRLLIVADGALQYIPFAALPKPDGADRCSNDEPLVLSHEIVHLPSASALSLLRRGLDRPTATRRSVAVVADPVFATNDPRLAPSKPVVERHGAATDARSKDESDLASFQRLHFSRDEADAILSLVEPSAGFRATGFDANKETLTEGLLAGSRFIHLATHGIVDTTTPQLSGIVLSLFDQEGEPRDGFLSTHEIYNLDLTCELVVLSACQTALGKEIRGEGLIGLARAFMYAGAARAMVSLWNVSDEGTAELMELFYQGVLKEGQRPAAALRAAQVSMLGHDIRAAPYHWAGFVIQGDWR